MSSTNLIADTLTIIRNAIRIHKQKVDVPSSTMINSIMEILKKENYIEDFKSLDGQGKRRLRVYLKFDDENMPCINGLRCISKPSLRVYANHTKLPRVLRGQGIAIVSTSKGLLTDKEARDAKIGGEIVCYVW